MEQVVFAGQIVLLLKAVPNRAFLSIQEIGGVPRAAAPLARRGGTRDRGLRPAAAPVLGPSTGYRTRLVDLPSCLSSINLGSFRRNAPRRVPTPRGRGRTLWTSAEDLVGRVEHAGAL